MTESEFTKQPPRHWLLQWAWTFFEVQSIGWYLFAICAHILLWLSFFQRDHPDFQ